MRSVLLQYARGQQHEALLDCCRARNRDYCARHDIEYVIHGAEDVDVGKFDYKACALLDYIAYLEGVIDGVVVANIGVDMLIVKPEVNIMDVLGDADICVHGSDVFCNEGFIVSRNSTAVRATLTKIRVLGPVNAVKTDISYRAHEILKAASVKVKRVGSEWNWYDTFGAAKVPVTCAEDDAIVRGWHGGPHSIRLEKMQNKLSELAAVRI